MAIKSFKTMAQSTAESIQEQEPVARRKSAFDGMLNPVSKSARQMEELIMVPIENIIANAKNEKVAGMREIEELASNINDVGLQQPLVGYPIENGKWKLLTGHRRLEACKKLYEEGEERFARLPMKEQVPSDLDLPLSDEMKENYLLISTNTENRTDYTPQERMAQYEMLKEIYDELDKAGQKPKGRRRELIANNMKMPTMTVSRYEQIDKNATKKVKTEFKENGMDLTATTTLAKESPETQDKALREAKKEAKKTPEQKVTKAMVDDAIEKVKKKQKIDDTIMNAPEPMDGEEKMIEISEHEFVYIEELLANARMAYAKAYSFTVDEYKKLNKATDKLTKAIEDVMKYLE